MISICSKLEGMVKDEKKGTKEYLELQFDIMKSDISREGKENYIDTLDIIADDENVHHDLIKKMMKDLKCR